MNYSLLRYPGGKTRAVNILHKYIPDNTKVLISPFFGGGSFEIFLSKKGIKVFGYDNFYPLVCFWKSVLYDKGNLVKLVKDCYPLHKNEFYAFQKNINGIIDETEIGALFYVLNRCSFSGTGLSGGMSPNHPRFTLSAIERLKDFDAKFSIEHMSFEESINKNGGLIYADPPYLIEQSLYGTKGDMHKDFNHELLGNILNDRKNFILSYNNCEQIRDMYHEHRFVYPEWTYGMGNSKQSKEILIISNNIK
jgi:DNA adenine methylase